MKSPRAAAKFIAIAVAVLLYEEAIAQERPTLLVGHGTLSGSILPLWVGAEAKLFDKHGVQVKPIYLPRAAGRPALLAGEIQIYFSAGPPLVQMRLSGGDIAVTSCAAHKLTSKYHGRRRRFKNSRSCAAKYSPSPTLVRRAILPPNCFWRAKGSNSGRMFR